MTIQTKTTSRAVGLFTVIAVVFVLYVLKPLVMPLLFAMILGVMIFPVQQFFEKKWRCSRMFATIFSIFLIFSVTVILLFIIFFQLQEFTNGSEDYVGRISELYENTVAYLGDAFNMSNSKTVEGVDNTESSSGVDFNLNNLLKGNFDKITSLLTRSGSFMSDLVLVPIYLFFFLYYRRFLRTFAYKLFKHKSQSFVNKMINKIYNVQQNYLAGLLKVMLIVGVLNTITLLALGIENAIFFGFFAAILLLIPYIGVIIGALLPAMVALVTKDSIWYAFGVIGFFGFIQFLEGNFITPKITGSKVNMNSFVAILSLIAFAMLWGISGMIVALPIIASLKIIFDHTPGYEAYGFLMSEPVDALLQSKARQRLKVWKTIRQKKNK
ncbi:AI-2E family transporter [Kordia algicida OT-1]|uniref:Permease n=1 Tax=Kordia algicida OT-1 TaxID=391587 RepID=A9E8G7_9FLAO|nr:AI-2E family transporter [Kordia algicida]EDP94773.1 permease [Kordia algicida OT-1]